jgi:hypothetical protein
MYFLSKVNVASWFTRSTDMATHALLNTVLLCIDKKEFVGGFF